MTLAFWLGRMGRYCACGCCAAAAVAPRSRKQAMSGRLEDRLLEIMAVALLRFERGRTLSSEPRPGRERLPASERSHSSFAIRHMGPRRERVSFGACRRRV